MGEADGGASVGLSGGVVVIGEDCGCQRLKLKQKRCGYPSLGVQMPYDNSQLQQFKNCHESYRLKYQEELRKIDSDEDEHDKEYGTAIHKGLEIIYRGGSLKEAQDGFAKEYPLQLNMEDKAKTIDNGLLLLEQYLKHWQAEDKTIEVLQNEKTDTFEIAPGIPFIVKVDLVVKKQGCIYAMDHKTTKKSFGWDYWGQYEPNSQVTAQTAYVKERFGECSGVIINALSLGWVDKNKLFTLSQEADARQYSILEKKYSKYHGEDMWYASGFHCEFQRQLFNRNQDQVTAWKWDTQEWIGKVEEIKKKYSTFSQSVWPKNEGQCRFCSYKPVCVSCADPQIIEQLFEKHDSKAYLKGE